MKNKKSDFYEYYYKQVFPDMEKFYTEDLERYNISKNVNFLIWKKFIIKKNNYIEFIDNKELQDLIDRIATWYELKYPESNILAEEENIYPTCESFSFEQLKYRLSYNQFKLLQCPYRELANVVINSPMDNVNFKIYISLPAKDENNEDFIILADKATGKVIIRENSILSKYVKKHSILIDDLYDILIKENVKFDNKALLQAINLNKLDKELRNKVLNLAALKLLYSKNTTPYAGYERARKFIDEFNNNVDELNLSTNEIDNIIAKDYSTKKTKVKRFDSKKK